MNDINIFLAIKTPFLKVFVKYSLIRFSPLSFTCFTFISFFISNFQQENIIVIHRQQYLKLNVWGEINKQKKPISLINFSL